jgi:hypothetical protein
MIPDPQRTLRAGITRGARASGKGFHHCRRAGHQVLRQGGKIAALLTDPTQSDSVLANAPVILDAERPTLSFGKWHYVCNVEEDGVPIPFEIPVPCSVAVWGEEESLAAQKVGTQSKPLQVTFTNTGTGTLTLKGIAISPQLFTQSNTCASSLAASNRGGRFFVQIALTLTDRRLLAPI